MLSLLSHMVRKLMVFRHLPAAAKFSLTVALGCALILETILDFVDRASPRSAVLDAAVAVVLVAVPVTYLMGVILLYIHVSTPAAAPPAAGASSRLAAVACTLAFALVVALAVFLLLAVLGGSAPTSGGFTPT